MNKSVQQSILVTLTSIMLAITFIATGYAFVSGLPFVTGAVASSSVDDVNSPFGKPELVQGAKAVRDYSFGTHIEDALYSTIVEMNNSANTEYAGSSINEIKAAPMQYTITEDQLTHLNDVYELSSSLFFPLIGVAAMTAFLLMCSLMMFGLRAVSRSLLFGGVITIVMFAVLGIWAVVSFDSLFAVFHSLFFADGTWTFPADSLLITMLPERFWSGIALDWLFLSCLLALISFCIGVVLDRKFKKAKAAKRNTPEYIPQTTENAS